MKREKIAILPKVFDYDGDMSKKWYVYFSVKDPRSGKMVVKKLYAGLFKEKNKEKRYKVAEQIISKYTELLRTGYNFLTDETESIYSDSLQYQNSVKVYQERRKANRSFNYFASMFLNERTSGMEESTVQTYRSKPRIFDAWLKREHMDQADITALDNPTIIRFFMFLNNEHKSSDITYNKYKNILNAVFNYVLDQGKVTHNPVQRIPKCFRVVDQASKPINPEHIQKIILRLKQNPQLYLFAMFEYYCFMRPGKEIRLMKIGWIDWGNGVIKVPVANNKTKLVKMPIIPDELMHIMMKDYKLHTYPKDYYVFGREGEPGPQYLGKNTMAYRFMKIRKELDLPEDYTLYCFKHTGNSMLRRSGAASYDRMMQNGHTSIKTTEIYDRDKFGFESEHIRKNFPAIDKPAKYRG